MAMYLLTEVPGGVAHGHKLSKCIAKRRYVVELLAD